MGKMRAEVYGRRRPAVKTRTRGRMRESRSAAERAPARRRDRDGGRLAAGPDLGLGLLYSAGGDARQVLRREEVGSRWKQRYSLTRRSLDTIGSFGLALPYNPLRSAPHERQIDQIELLHKRLKIHQQVADQWKVAQRFQAKPPF